MTTKYTADNFAADLAGGRYTDWGAPKYFVCSDGESFCFKCAQEQKRMIRGAIRRGDNQSGWRVIGCDVNWENDDLHCAQCYKQIESAYGDGARENPARAKKPARRNASRGARKNPTAYARKLPSPFDRLTARDWSNIREAAAELAGQALGDRETAVMTSQGYVGVDHTRSRPSVSAFGVSVHADKWPRAVRRATTKRSKRRAGAAKRTRKVNQRSNPRRKAAAKRSNPSTRYCAAGARSLKKGLSRGGRASAKCRWDAARSNPRGDDREVTIYEVLYDGRGAGAAGDGTHIARFKNASEAARFAAINTAYGRPAKSESTKVPARLARRWGVM